MTNRSFAVSVLALLVTAGGCATSGTERDPAPSLDMAKVRELLNCPNDRTPVCTERMGKPYQCFCADRDALQQLLEPDKY